MSPDTKAKTAPADVGAPASPPASNAAVISAIQGHHAQLADQLHELTGEAVSCAFIDEAQATRARLVRWYRTELIPHAQAEEAALYSRAADMDQTRLLVRGMIDEHRALISLVDDLEGAESALRVVIAAAAAHALFGVHLSKENDLLLPALDAAGVDLAAALEGMHQILGGHGEHSHAPDHDHAGGCGHHHHADVHPAGTELLQIEPTGAVPAPVTVDDGEGLDVRALPHGSRHDIIFNKLDALALGEALVIVNDHDPKPLRYQTAAIWPDRFEWSYLQAGPQVWRVAITRVG